MVLMTHGTLYLEVADVRNHPADVEEVITMTMTICDQLTVNIMMIAGETIDTVMIDTINQNALTSKMKFKSRGDAERILTKMEDIIYKNRFVSLLDFYDLTGQPTRSTDDNYGWTNLDRAKVERLRSDNGYIIRFPSPMPLDREYD